MPQDLHAAKASHLSVPVDSGVELHLKHSDIKIKCEQGRQYWIKVPVIMTSDEGDATRFLQHGTMQVETRNQPDPDTDREAKTIPLDKLRNRIGVVKPREEYNA